MLASLRPTLACSLLLAGTSAFAQQVQPVAATVNGQPITETAVQRALSRLPAEKRAEARGEIVQFLIDNLVIDQYLGQLYAEMPKEEVEKRLEQVRAEIKKDGQSLEKVMAELMLTEDELRAQVVAQARWDRYTSEQVTEKTLREYMTGNIEMFDGCMVRARHILLEPAPNDPASANLNHQRLAAIRAGILDSVQKKVAEIPSSADALTREKARVKAMDEAFAAAAHKESSCPSKEQGGDLGWFPRAGSMVEPFARAAFALKPYDLSDVVTTPFGAHLILVTDRRAGKEIKFEDVKDVVREVYCDKLRESLASQLRARATVTINEAAKH
jgi:hypothetical protein